MGNKKFGLTTYVIVGISLVALYFVGKTVTPPPAAPPVEVKPVTAQSPAVPSPTKQEYEARKAADQQKSRAEKIRETAAHVKTNPQANGKEFNPNGIDVDSDYWHDKSIQDGDKGEKAMAAKVAAAKAKMPPPPQPHAESTAPPPTQH